MIETGVRGSFHAAHDDPRGIKPKHWHLWHARAWFPEGQDGRDLLEQLDKILGPLNGNHLSPPRAWSEGIAKMIGGALEGCIAVEIWRDDERIEARWRDACQDPDVAGPRSPEKKAQLIRLYRAGMPLRDIAEEIGGTYDGIRSTVRKMRARGELPRRVLPKRQRR